MAEKVFVCGGDIRSIYMADLLNRKGYDICVCMSDEKPAYEYGLKVTDFNKGTDNAALVLLGLPAVRNDMTVNCPLFKEKLPFEMLLKKIDKNTVVAGGRFCQDACLLAKSLGIRLLDYSGDEVFQIENAFYTAEGAVEAIIKNTVRSLGELNILVAGYGRIAKALTRFLSVLGSKITVYARKNEQRAWAGMYGLSVTDKLEDLYKYDVLVNTAPAKLFNEELISGITAGTLVIDLSARPGFVSKELCDRYGIKLIFLPGLPAVSAPRSAGEAAGRAVIRMYTALTEGDGHNGA